MKSAALALGSIFLLLQANVFAAPAVASVPKVEVRFYPQAQLWSYEVDAARGLNSAVLQNTAIANHGTPPVTVEGVRFEVLRGSDVVLTRTLYRADLDKAAKAGGALGALGMLDALAFQFAPDKLLGEGITLASTRTLARGQALYLPAQVFVFSGTLDQVRVTVDLAADAADAVATLPLRHGVVAGKYRFPLQGSWVAAAGSTLHSHHRWAVPEEFAFDFVRYGASGGTFGGDGRQPSNYYAYGAPVLATADGEVVEVREDMPDSTAAMRQPGETLTAYQQRLRETQDALLAAGADALAGNHVILRHANGVFSVYGHLAPHSLKVAKGERVRAGQQIGAVGTSGNSTEPHLHFHLCDAPDPLLCVGMPVAFDDIELPFSDGPRMIQSGDLVEPAVQAKR